MKPNPKNFEPFIDPNGGEWIKIKTGKFKNIVWRPINIKVEEQEEKNGDGTLSFESEFLGDVPEDFNTFEKLAGSIITTILRETIENHENSDSNSSKD